MTTEINREQFEAWLFAQPDDRTFNYFCSDCLVGTYLQESTQWKPDNHDFISVDNVVGFEDFREKGQVFPFPEWLKTLLPRRNIFDTFVDSTVGRVNCGDMKARYTQLFGPLVPVSQEPTQPTPKAVETPVLESITQ